jgi:hypothetical protein
MKQRQLEGAAAAAGGGGGGAAAQAAAQRAGAELGQARAVLAAARQAEAEAAGHAQKVRTLRQVRQPRASSPRGAGDKPCWGWLG